MLESQLQQFANFVPSAGQGKILGQPEGLESAHLVDIFDVGTFWSDPLRGAWISSSLPPKKGDPGRLVIPISIGCEDFNEAICDFGASISIVPKVICEKLKASLSYTTMCLQLADQSLCYPMGALEDVCV